MQIVTVIKVNSEAYFPQFHDGARHGNIRQYSLREYCPHAFGTWAIFLQLWEISLTIDLDASHYLHIITDVSNSTSYELTRLFSVFFLFILMWSIVRIHRVSTLHGKVAPLMTVCRAKPHSLARSLSRELGVNVRACGLCCLPCLINDATLPCILTKHLTKINKKKYENSLVSS